MGYAVKQSQTARPLLFKLFLTSDHLTGATGKSPTVTLSKNGAAFGSPSGAVSEVGNGWYKVAGNATDTATLGPLVLHATASACDEAADEFEVVAYDPENSTGLGLSALPVAAPIVSATVNDAGATTTGFIGSSGLTATDDFYNGAVLTFTSGALAGLARKISDYTGSTKTFDFSGAAGSADAAWPSAPANGAAFIIIGRIG